MVKQATNFVVLFILSFILLVIQQSYADVASGKPAWEVRSTKVCGDKLCSKNENSMESKIPSWVKNNAKWWAANQISDQDFAKGLEYLIKQKIITIPAETQTQEGSENQIPIWLRRNAGWWADGQLSDSEFIKSIQWLINNRIIRIAPSQNITCSGTALCLTGKVQTVIDGDTIYIDGYKIRLSLTNTPERYEEGYSEATTFTRNLCSVGSEILVDQDDCQPYDRYGRVLGKVFCIDKLLNEELLENNHAWILTQYCSKSEFSKESWATMYGC